MASIELGLSSSLKSLVLPNARARKNQKGKAALLTGPAVIEFAIIGLGAWGMSVLERTVSRCRNGAGAVRVHVIQPGSSDGGVYGIDQPDYLVLNVACGQISLYASPDEGDDPPYALSLYDWAVRRGYRWVGNECRVGTEGETIDPGDYLPRRIMGEYLSWFYSSLVASAPPNLEIVRHAASAIDVIAEAHGRERIMLDTGAALTVHHVVLTSGHTWNAEPAARLDRVTYVRPYPVEYFTSSALAGVPIALSGMGLVAFDVLAALTIGRGGTFIDDRGRRKRYVRSGREPTILMYSRSGMPYCAKSAYGGDPTGAYEPIICTPEVFRDLRTLGRQIDFRADLLPLLLAEMQCRYLTHAALVRGGANACQHVRRTLSESRLEGRFEKAVETFELNYGSFDPVDHLFAGSRRHYVSSRDYQSQIHEIISDDLAEAVAEGGSPVKAAQEVTRILRDQMRSVIEFGGLSLESYVDFQANVRGQINRLEAGPPPQRVAQLLALLDAGVVQIPFGPSPEVSAAPDGRVAIRSTQLDRLHMATAAFAVRGHLDLPSLARSASPLLSRMYSKGRFTQLCYGDTPVGSVAISEDFHPFDAEGRLQHNVSLLGVLTEGVRYFTHYLPSPRSRLRAVLDAQACVESIIG
jgi:hypothetical protein